MQQQMVNSETGLSMCSFSSSEENKWALVVKFTQSRISSIATTPIFDKGYRYSLDDFTKDGIPDIIQVMEVIDGELKYHEAFSIKSGTVEPIPDELMKGRTDEFHFDDEVVAYLKSKLEPVGSANASNAASVNLDQSSRIR